nr:MAG TPA: hypothetical protein [Caudoviricetes sp.]
MARSTFRLVAVRLRSNLLRLRHLLLADRKHQLPSLISPAL